MTPIAVEHLTIPPNTDLLVVWDYRNDEFDFEFNQYKQISLIAWSMGVWAAERWIAQQGDGLQSKIIRSIAICGTSYPMHDSFGIPCKIFEGTLNSLCESGRERFNRRMCGKRTYPTLFKSLSERSTDEIHHELHRVYDLEQENSQKSSPNKNSHWQLALIGIEDKVIPSINQMKYWQTQETKIIIYPHSTHYLHGELTSWEELWQ